MAGPRSGRPRLRDVAERAGVSQSTASRALNSAPTVDKDMANRVIRAAAELKYEPNRLARNLRRKAGSIWAILISDIENPFFTSVVRGVEDVALEQGYSIVLCNTDETAEKERRYIDVALAEQVAGIIISPASEQSDIGELVKHDVPIVTIDRQLVDADVDAVLVDNRDGARRATNHLIEAGYQRVACVSGPERVTTAIERLGGYRDALRKESGRVAAGEDLVSYGDYRVDGGYAATAALLKLSHPPDAIFISNNLMAAGALAAIRDAGIDIPESIGVTAFDDTPWAQLMAPALTVVAQPARRIGQAAASLLIRRMENQAAPFETVVLPTELRVRASSGGPSRSS